MQPEQNAQTWTPQAQHPAGWQQPANHPDAGVPGEAGVAWPAQVHGGAAWSTETQGNLAWSPPEPVQNSAAWPGQGQSYGHGEAGWTAQGGSAAAWAAQGGGAAAWAAQGGGAAAWPAQGGGAAAWPAQGHEAAWTQAPSHSGNAWAAQAQGEGWPAQAPYSAWPDQAADTTGADPAGDSAWPGPGQPATGYATTPNAPQEPSGLRPGQATYPPAYQEHRTPTAQLNTAWAPPTGQWQGEQPGQQPARPGGDQWHSEPTALQPVVPGGDQWHSEPTALQPVVPGGNQWHSQPTAVQPAGPGGNQWQSQSTALQPVVPGSDQWQSQPTALQPVVTPAPTDDQWRMAAASQATPEAGGLRQAQEQTQAQPPSASAHPQSEQAPRPAGGLWQSMTHQPPATPVAEPTAPSGLWQAQAQAPTEPSGLWHNPGTQPAQAAPQAAYPAPEPQAGPDEAQPWMIQFNSQPPAAPGKRRSPWKAVTIGLVVLVAVLGGGAGGANAYAKHSVCSTLKGESTALNQDSAKTDDAEMAEMREDADTLRRYGHMLVISGDLREAVNGLADDEDQLVDLLKSTGTASPSNEAAAKKALTELMTVVGSVNSHAREAQKACGLPVTGILGS
jgi:hypothetical protein